MMTTTARQPEGTLRTTTAMQPGATLMTTTGRQPEGTMKTTTAMQPGGTLMTTTAMQPGGTMANVTTTTAMQPGGTIVPAGWTEVEMPEMQPAPCGPRTEWFNGKPYKRCFMPNGNGGWTLAWALLEMTPSPAGPGSIGARASPCPAKRSRFGQ